MAPALSTGEQPWHSLALCAWARLVTGCRRTFIINVCLPFAMEIGEIALLLLRKAFHTYIYMQGLRGMSFVISEKA